MGLRLRISVAACVEVVTRFAAEVLWFESTGCTAYVMLLGTVLAELWLRGG